MIFIIFIKDKISCSLHGIGNGDLPKCRGGIKSKDDNVPCSDESWPMIKSSHCSFCGHPGSKRAHFKFSCEYCGNGDNEGCFKKPEGFKCNCSYCYKVQLHCRCIALIRGCKLFYHIRTVLL